MPAVKDFLITIYKASMRPRGAFRDLAASSQIPAQAALVGALALFLVLLGMAIANLALLGGRFSFNDDSTYLVAQLSEHSLLSVIAGVAIFAWVAPLVSRNRSLAWSAFWLSLSPALLIAGIASPFLVLGLALGWLSPAGVALPLVATFNPIFYLLLLSFSLFRDASVLGLGGWVAILIVVFQAWGSFRSLYAGAQELSGPEQIGGFGALLLRLLVLNALWSVLAIDPSLIPFYDI